MNKRRNVWLFSVGVLLAALIAGCGESSSSSSTATKAASIASGSAAKEVEEAKQFVDSHLKGITFNPGKPFKLPTGVTLGILTASQANPGSAEIASGAEEAAKGLGWKTQLVDGKGTPPGWTAGMQQLIQAHVSAVVMPGIADEGLPQAMKEAANAKIPVIAIGAGTRLAAPIQSPSIASIDLPYKLMGEMQAYFMISESKAEPTAILMTDKAIPALYKISTTTKEVFSKCAGCKIKQTLEVGEPTNWTTKYAEVVQGLLAQYPKGQVEWLVPPYDAATQGMSEAVKASGRTEIKAVSGGCIAKETGGLEEMRSGEGPVVYCNVTANRWMGWAGANEAARILAGEKAEDVAIPIAFYTKANLPPGQPPATAYTPYDYKAAYTKLWAEHK